MLASMFNNNPHSSAILIPLLATFETIALTRKSMSDLYLLLVNNFAGA